MAETRYLDLEQMRILLRAARLGLPSEAFDARIYQDQFLGPHIRIVGRLPDTHNPGKRIDIGVNSRIPPVKTAAQFYDWLLHRWAEIWIHEARETLWVNGKLWSDPHAVTEPAKPKPPARAFLGERPCSDPNCECKA